MTDHGNKLADLTIEAVTDRLREASDGKAIKRLVAAREYLDGRPPAEISAKYGWPEQTIYSWFDRFEAEGLDGALHDESPPGRPSSLSDGEIEAFEAVVSDPPKAAGFDAETWNATLAQQFLQEEFDQEFSRRHVRRLLKRATRS